ncbi:unnamed protein product [Caenorhabditis sp. 36 PRJEB53466]|nr:unnamed protein product [Caenorhabditis sp. 36 PRJEB53466]
MQTLLCLSIILESVGCLVVPLSQFLNGNNAVYTVNKSSRIYVISNSDHAILRSLNLTTTNGLQNSDGFTLSTRQSDGSLLPLIPSKDGDNLTVAYRNTDEISGWLYINHVTDYLNVFPLDMNWTDPIGFKTGTNVFFRLNSPAVQIPVARNVVLGDSVVFCGYVGLPDDEFPLKFFDSTSIDGATNYSQLELPLKMFHFTSNGVNVQYEVTYSMRIGLVIGNNGLIMSDDFPSPILITNNYHLLNANNHNIDSYFLPRLDWNQNYAVNMTLYFPEPLDPLFFPIPSWGSTNISSNSPVNRILVSSGGPFAIQYRMTDTSATTTANPFETSTRSSGFVSLMTVFLTVFTMFLRVFV